ncbi:MAG: HAMP domain-containing histidine kinase [Clostridia bacterium]|nr:HAMP domain-containing histidine kinase [Clostridia bacterium]
MNNFRKIAVSLLVLEVIITIFFNVILYRDANNQGKRQYRVDIKRAELALSTNGSASPSDYPSIVNILPFDENYKTNNDYAVVNVNGKLYSIEYVIHDSSTEVLFMNIGLGGMIVITLFVLVYVDRKILKPFNTMSNYSLELARGNLSNPIKQDKNKFFGKFMWGMDMLRDNLETNRKKELELQKEKKTLILSISHDIKTPLSAIKLYTRALSSDLYDTPEKRQDALDGISRNALDIEKYVADIVAASKEDFLNLEATIGEFYLSSVIARIKVLYEDKFARFHTEFKINEFSDLLLKGDPDRLEEVIQNILENAIKYGDGKRVTISFSEEEDCTLISVTNSGCSISEDEIPHLFESFYRGTNSSKHEGSGLGLYIARSLMRIMDGDIFANINGDEFSIVVVLRQL